MTPSIEVNGVQCIRYAISHLSAKQLQEAAARTLKCTCLATSKEYLLAELKALGYRFAANPGNGIVLLK